MHTGPRHPAFTITAAALCAGLLASTALAGVSSAAEPSVDERSAASPTLATAPGKRKAGTLNWKSCTDPKFDRWEKIDSAFLDWYDCAPFARPLDRKKPKGKKVKLATVRLPASGSPGQYKGTLFMNPGGPGQSGLQLSEIVFLLPPEIRESFDFVTWDPRGIGASTPAIKGPGCNIPKPTRPNKGHVNWQRVLKKRVAQVDVANAKCFDKNRKVIENGGTVANAHDLEAMRKAVGDSKLNYWGISYGTVLGSTYAQKWPQKVRALVFDGNVDPQMDIQGWNQASVAPDHSIGFFLEANPDEHAKFNKVREYLDHHVLKLPGGKKYTRWDLLDVLNDDVPFFIKPGGDWTEAKKAINKSYAAIFGSGSERSDARKALTHSSLRSPSTGTVGSLWSAVVCQDYGSRFTSAQQKSGIDWAVRNGPIYGGSLGVDYLTTCNGYGGAKAHPIPQPKRYGPSVPGIISNSTRDGETPYQWAINMARVYRSMRMVTLVGGVHGIYGLGESECVNVPISEFLISGNVPPLDLGCPYSPPFPIP